MQEFRTLLLVLQRELRQQERLLEALTKERTAIVKLHGEQLEEIQREKEALLNEAQGLEEKRSLVLQKLSPAVPDKKLASIVQACPMTDVKQQLSTVGQELKRAAVAVAELNSNNGQLLKQSLGLVGSVLSIMQSTPAGELPTYSPSGQVSEHGSRPSVKREA
jgi:flagellar biosynthesis/type III secretory pathway chaperone